jgi:hypothetical protein
MIIFENKRVFLWCEVPMKTERDAYKGYWLRSHVKFLRAGSRFRVDDTVYLATSDPFYRKVEEPEPTLLKMVAGMFEPKGEKPEEGWTVNYVKE